MRGDLFFTLISTPRALNPNLVQRADLKAVARPDQRCGTIFFDYRRTRRVESRRQRISVEDLGVHPAAGGTDVNTARVRGM